MCQVNDADQPDCPTDNKTDGNGNFEQKRHLPNGSDKWAGHMEPAPENENADVEGDVKGQQPPTWIIWANLILMMLVNLLTGFTFSLLSPFYTKEAVEKGITVSQAGLVYSSVFLTSIVCTPVFGRFIAWFGCRNLFLSGQLLAGATNILFGFLQWVQNPTAFLLLSFVIRIVSSMGESATVTAVYPLVAQVAGDRHRSMSLSAMETMFGLGQMIGPFVGGVLYQVGGFYLPFALCGATLLLTAALSAVLLLPEQPEPADINQGGGATYWTLMKMPAVAYSSFSLCVVGLSSAWYLPTLQPFVEAQFHLNSVVTGALFMIDGAIYALFSPLWAGLLDRGLPPYQAFFWGNLFIAIGYCLLGPAPFLPFLPKSIYLVAAALVFHGIGVASIFITSLTFMLSYSVGRGGQPDSKRTRGMITSLWFLNESLGAYIGSSGGALAFDKMGFENGTMIVLALILLAIVVIPCVARQGQADADTDAEANNDGSENMDEDEANEKTALLTQQEGGGSRYSSTTTLATATTSVTTRQHACLA